MQQAYLSGDCYMAFAIQSGLAPPGATKKTHKDVRNRCKQCILGVQYGMGAYSLAYRLGIIPAEAQFLLDLHRRTYPRYWRWADAAVDHAVLGRRIDTVFGWTLHLADLSDPNPRSLRNFPCQANGAEMLRLGCALMAERDVPVVGPVHDAVLVEGPEGLIGEIVAEARDCQRQASLDVLDGFEVRTNVGPRWWDGHDGIVRSPDRYMDEDGVGFWNRVMSLCGLPEFRDGKDLASQGPGVIVPSGR
jgi:DNA polymerase I-like protein with 3'-5' exonuclease and polymerase domains